MSTPWRVNKLRTWALRQLIGFSFGFHNKLPVAAISKVHYRRVRVGSMTWTVARIVGGCFLHFAILLLFALPAQAAPKWLKRTVQVAVYVAPVATSLWATHEGHLCRQRNDVAFCSGGYGAFAAREGARGGVSITFSGLSWWGHKQGYKEWFAPAVGMAAFNSYVAVKQSRINVKETQ